MFDKIVIVTLKTRVEELIERFNTREQAKFYIEHMGLNFAEYDREHETYTAAVRTLRHQFEDVLPKMQVIERGFLPNFIFTPQDLVVTIGRDGLVVNTAKYLSGQPIVAVNPDPGRIDGVLLPFTPQKAKQAVNRVLENRAVFHSITMAEVQLNDGQHLLAFNDFYLGQRTHLSSRYSVTYHKRTEQHSSSGVLVITGAGSTGWFSSQQNMAAAMLIRDALLRNGSRTTKTRRRSSHGKRIRGTTGALFLSNSRVIAAAMFCCELNQPVEPAPVMTRTPLDECCSVRLW